MEKTHQDQGVLEQIEFTDYEYIKTTTLSPCKHAGCCCSSSLTFWAAEARLQNCWVQKIWGEHCLLKGVAIKFKSWVLEFLPSLPWYLGMKSIQVIGTSLLVQWLRICRPMQRTQVQSLLGELRSHIPQSLRITTSVPACNKRCHTTQQMSLILQQRPNAAKYRNVWKKYTMIKHFLRGLIRNHRGLFSFM